jgi:hypothetical protein
LISLDHKSGLLIGLCAFALDLPYHTGLEHSMATVGSRVVQLEAEYTFRDKVLDLLCVRTLEGGSGGGYDSIVPQLDRESLFIPLFLGHGDIVVAA